MSFVDEYKYRQCVVHTHGGSHHCQSPSYSTEILILISITMTFKAIFPILYALGPALALAQGKRGLAYNDGALANLFSGYSHVTWGYSWGYERNGLGASLDFNPMLWGLPSSLDPQWTAAVHATGVEAILGFNEPDLGSQSNISPADAAAGYLVSLQPFAAQVRISTPAVTNGPPPNMGTGWMDQFFEHCRTCTIDLVAIHWYANNDPEGFKAHVQQFYDKYHLPIWITEFAASSCRRFCRGSMRSPMSSGMPTLVSFRGSWSTRVETGFRSWDRYMRLISG